MSHNEDDTRAGTDGSVSGSNGKTPEQETRRRLLKAAAMAPVIYTVSGAGVAQAMASATCPTRQDNQLTVPGQLPPGQLTHGATYGDVCKQDCDEEFNTYRYYSPDGNSEGAWVSAQCWTSFVTSSISAKTRIV